MTKVEIELECRLIKVIACLVFISLNVNVDSSLPNISKFPHLLIALESESDEANVSIKLTRFRFHIFVVLSSD